MGMAIEKTGIPDLWVVRPRVFEDDRGFFQEIYRRDTFAAAGLPDTFVQLNHSGSVRNTVRGLHFQWDPPMAKMMWVARGRALMAAVDIRKNSPTLGKWFTVEGSEDSRVRLVAPPGFARGFCALSEWVEIQYLCTGTYNPQGESGILWNDPAIGIPWPVPDPILSEKDRKAQTLAAWLEREESGRFTV